MVDLCWFLGGIKPAWHLQIVKINTFHKVHVFHRSMHIKSAFVSCWSHAVLEWQYQELESAMDWNTIFMCPVSHILWCFLICEYSWDSFRSLCMLWHVINTLCVTHYRNFTLFVVFDVKWLLHYMHYSVSTLPSLHSFSAVLGERNLHIIKNRSFYRLPKLRMDYHQEKHALYI